MRAPTVALVALVAACHGAPANEAPRKTPMTLEARTDLPRLQRYFETPATTRAARWVVLPRGVPSSAPGPTDTVLWAFLELSDDAWATLGPTGPSETVAVPSDVARALLPPALAAAHAVTGPSYDITKRTLNPYAGKHGVRVADGLLFVLYSR